MIHLPYVKRVALIRNRVDFRKGHDGLLGVSYDYHLQPYEGDLVIFVGRGMKSIKVLMADRNGLWVLYKKFKEGAVSRQFKFLADKNMSEITLDEVALLRSNKKEK